MANYVHLSNISLGQMPTADQWKTLTPSQDYEARYSIPMFWLCMFSAEHIALTQAFTDDFGEHHEAYPYLLASHLRVVNNLSKRRLVIACLDPARLSLYDQFCKRASGATQDYWLMETSDIVAMSGPADLEAELVRSFAGLEDYTTALLNKDAASMQHHWMTLWLGDIKQHPEKYSDEVLIGSSADHTWPKLKDVEIPKPAKKWWQFRK
jgi:hypothetical protein